MDSLDPRLRIFLTRCDAARRVLGVTQSTLSTKLFTDGKRLSQITAGNSDIGIARLAKAERALSELEGRGPLLRSREGA